MARLKYVGLRNGIKHYEHTVPYITGLHGCSCHPFSSWDESDLHHKRKFNIGDKVKHRCSGLEGEIARKEGGFYWIVKFGNLPCEHVLHHSANLVLIKEFTPFRGKKPVQLSIF